MSVDLTPIFRSIVKTIEARNRGSVLDDSSSPAPEKRPPHFSSTTVAFTAQSRLLLAQITDVRDLIIRRRRDYLNVFSCSHHGLASHLPAGGLSDREREKFDAEVKTAMQNCTQMLAQLENARARARLSPAQTEHLQAIVNIIRVYFKAVQRMFNELIAIRVRKNEEMKRMTRLSEIGGGRLATIDGAREEKGKMEKAQQGKQGFEGSETRRRKASPEVKKEEEEAISQLPEWERVQLQVENERLLEKASAVNRDVGQIEGKVAEISRLQEIFAEKVMEQDRDIIRINETAVDTTENLRSGNEQIRQAIQNSASRRVILLFCLIVITFTLLFLDWYNP